MSSVSINNSSNQVQVISGEKQITVGLETQNLSVQVSSSQRGVEGKKGDSAYQVAVNNGYVGTEAEWVESLKPDIALGDVAISGDLGNTLEKRVDGLYSTTPKTQDILSFISSLDNSLN